MQIIMVILQWYRMLNKNYSMYLISTQYDTWERETTKPGGGGDRKQHSHSTDVYYTLNIPRPLIGLRFL